MEALINEKLQKIKDGRKRNNSLYYMRHQEELKRKRDEKKSEKTPKPTKTLEELKAIKQEYNRRYQNKLKEKLTRTIQLQ